MPTGSTPLCCSAEFAPQAPHSSIHPVSKSFVSNKVHRMDINILLKQHWSIFMNTETTENQEKMVILGGLLIYLHHSTNPEATVDGIDADDGPGWVLHNSIQKPNVVSHHYREP